MTDEEKYRIFKEACSDYFYDLSSITIQNLNASVYSYKMEGVNSPRIEKIGQSSSRHKTPYFDYMNKKEQYERESFYYKDLVFSMLNVISSVSDPLYIPLIFMIFIQRRKIAEVAEEYHISRAELSRIIKKLLMEQLNSRSGDIFYAVYQDKNEEIVC